MISRAKNMGQIVVPTYSGHESMIPFNIKTLEGIPEAFLSTVKAMLNNVPVKAGIAYFTIHGKKLIKNDTLRRGGPHTDGNYEPHQMDFGKSGGSGWKVGENGPRIHSPLHKRQYVKETGGLILASNYSSSVGWLGEYDEVPGVGGNCAHIELKDSFLLKENTIYYGNNHFIHESLPVNETVHRTMIRITLPETHEYLI